MANMPDPPKKARRQTHSSTPAFPAKIAAVARNAAQSIAVPVCLTRPRSMKRPATRPPTISAIRELTSVYWLTHVAFPGNALYSRANNAAKSPTIMQNAIANVTGATFARTVLPVPAKGKGLRS